MSELTADGRVQIRDTRRAIMRRMHHPRLAGLPSHQRVTLSELKLLIGRDLYLDIRRRGVMLPDSTLNPAVEAHRKNAHEQLYFLQVFMELNHTQTGEPHDLVADMARAIEAPPAAGPDALPSDHPDAAATDGYLSA